MKTNIDLKSLLLGVFLAAVVGLTVAAVTGTASVPGSRYQISAFGDANGNAAYVVDTATGEVWIVSQGGSPRKLADKMK
jgi:hypothetical protein